jgi:fermentation-respiration switch protein FrsA (DUF1100 family)
VRRSRLDRAFSRRGTGAGCQSRPHLPGRGGTADRLILLGESLGAAVAARLAIESPPTALVLRSPFPLVAAVHYPYLPTRLLLRDRYDTLQAVSLITAPILVVAGSDDSIVPPHFGRAVYEAASAADWALIEERRSQGPSPLFWPTSLG